MCKFLSRQPCLVIAVTVIFFLIFILNFPTGSAEWAAWIQAVGSILAIGSGFALHLWQRRADEIYSLRQIEKALTAVKAELDHSIEYAPENGEVGPDLRKLFRITLFLDRKAEQETLDYEVVMLVSGLSDFMRRHYSEVEKAKDSDELRRLLEALWDALDMDGSQRKRIDQAITSIRTQRRKISGRSIFAGWNSGDL